VQADQFLQLAQVLQLPPSKSGFNQSNEAGCQAGDPD
jgi:hypothetical protein